MKKPTYKLGEKYDTWFSGMPDGKSTILEIKPYTGRYTQYFRFVLKLSAPNTRAGYTEMAVE